MIMKRICIYLGDKCNFKCKYCMRNNENITNWNEFDKLNDTVITALKTRTSGNCDSVIVTGGEPLIYFDKIVDIFSYVDKNVHKKIITNGSLMTQEIVDYCNKHQIEVNLSHDGPNTEYTRGRDVLKDTHLCNLIKQIDVLTISCVITSKSNDVLKNYMYIKDKLNRNVFLSAAVITETGYNDEFVKDFDYDLFMKSYLDYINSVFFLVPNFYRSPRCKTRGINILMNGECVDLTTLRPLGCTVDEPFSKIVSHIKPIAKPCPIKNCIYKMDCTVQDQLKSIHKCKAEQVFIKIHKLLERGKRKDLFNND